MNSKQQRIKRRVVNRICARIRAEFECKFRGLQVCAEKTERENVRLRRVRVEITENLIPQPDSFAFSAKTEVKLEMLRFAVSFPLDEARKSHLPDLPCKRKALDLIYEAFKARAAANIVFCYDDTVRVYSASVVLPCACNGLAIKDGEAPSR